MKNLSPRQKEILKLVTEKNDLLIGEAQKLLGISQATAYREIQSLVQMGLAAKIPGGISRIEAASTHCVQCGRETNSRATFLIEQKNGRQVVACCAHCGLMALANQPDIKTAMTTDFFYGTIISARNAWYILNSDISLCCRPSVLSFSSRNEAQRFTKGFKGEVVNFSTAQNKIKEMMRL